jgi:hypothetical protein
MAARSTDVVFHNFADQFLMGLEDGLNLGSCTDPWQPPNGIAAEVTAAEWRSEPDGFLTGTEGHVRYRIGLAAKVGTRISAVSRTPNNLDLFVIGNNGVVYTSLWFAVLNERRA